MKEAGITWTQGSSDEGASGPPPLHDSLAGPSAPSCMFLYTPMMKGGRWGEYVGITVSIRVSKLSPDDGARIGQSVRASEKPGAILMQVQVLGAARDFSPTSH